MTIEVGKYYRGAHGRFPIKWLLVTAIAQEVGGTIRVYFRAHRWRLSPRFRWLGLRHWEFADRFVSKLKTAEYEDVLAEKRRIARWAKVLNVTFDGLDVKPSFEAGPSPQIVQNKKGDL